MFSPPQFNSGKGVGLQIIPKGNIRLPSKARRVVRISKKAAFKATNSEPPPTDANMMPDRSGKFLNRSITFYSYDLIKTKPVIAYVSLSFVVVGATKNFNPYENQYEPVALP